MKARPRNSAGTPPPCKGQAQPTVLSEAQKQARAAPKRPSTPPDVACSEQAKLLELRSELYKGHYLPSVLRKHKAQQPNNSPRNSPGTPLKSCRVPSTDMQIDPGCLDDVGSKSLQSQVAKTVPQQPNWVFSSNQKRTKANSRAVTLVSTMPSNLGRSFDSSYTPRSSKSTWGTGGAFGQHDLSPHPLLIFSKKKKVNCSTIGEQGRSIDEKEFGAYPELRRDGSAKQLAAMDRSQIMDIIGQNARTREKDSHGKKVPETEKSTDVPANNSQNSPEEDTTGSSRTKEERRALTQKRLKRVKTMTAGLSSMIGATKRVLNAIRDRGSVVLDFPKSRRSSRGSVEKREKCCLDDIDEADEGDEPEEENPRHISFSLEEKATLKKYFALHDLDNSDALCSEELMNVIDDMGRLPKQGSADREALEQIRTEVDINGDDELDFYEFVNLFSAYYYVVYERIYNEFVDASGVVQVSLLKPMLETVSKVGFYTTPYELDEFLSETGKSIAKSCAYGMSFDDFLDVMKAYRKPEFDELDNCAGYDESQKQFLRATFDEYDVDKSGSLDIIEVVVLFEKSYRPITDVGAFVELYARMDEDRSATLEFDEFLRLLRVFDKKHQRGDDGLSPKETGTTLASLRKKTEKASNVAQSCSSNQRYVHDEDTQKTAGELYTASLAQIAENGVVANQFGLDIREVNALRDTFEFCDVDSSGSIDLMEMESLLEHLGFSLTTKILKNVFRQTMTDFPEDEGINFTLFVKLVVKLYANLAIAAFSKVCESKGAIRMIDISKVPLAFYEIGQQITKQGVEDMLENLDLNVMDVSKINDISEAMFAKMLTLFRARRLAEWMQTYGFPKQELDKFQMIFAIHAEINARTLDPHLRISTDHIMPMLTECGYELLTKKDRWVMMRSLIRVEHGHDGEGQNGVCFNDLLLLLRHLENLRVAELRNEEMVVVKECRLDTESHMLLRKKFVSFSQGHGQAARVSIHNVRVLLISEYKVCVSQAQRKVLNKALSDIASHGEDSLSFLQFLRLLHQLDRSSAF